MPTRNKSILFVCFFFFSCLYHAFAQNAAPVLINDRTVFFEASPQSFIASRPSGYRAVLLQFGRLPSTSLQQVMRRRGILLQEYAGSNTYTALVSGSSIWSKDDGIAGIADFAPEYKIATALRYDMTAGTPVVVRVTFFNDVEPSVIASALAASGATVIPDAWQKKGIWQLSLPANKITHLASFYCVKFIGPYGKSVPLDLDGKSSLGALSMGNLIALGGKGLKGKDVVVGHGDNCSGIYHIDQADRVINYNNGDMANHGVLVNGLIGGDGIIDPAGQGIATDGTCISLFYDAVILLKEELFKGFNATLTNNSYRADRTSLCGYSGVYDALAQNLDSMAFKTPEQLDVFAAGNDGAAVCSPYAAEYFTISGGFQAAKNILVVGSCSRDLVVAPSSSRGPLKDGRLKPEVVAPGHNILCPVPINSYIVERGTSLACPQTTGILALLTERYRQLNSGKNPKSDLLKAIAINGASDLGRPGPDFWYGFGLVNGIRSLDIIENARYTRNVLGSGGGPQTITLTVPANTAQLKVLLYYHDPSASASSAVQLVNDLDLTVSEPGGMVHRPLILNPSPAAASANASEGADHLNNVEQVTINNPIAGTYTVTVSDFAIPQGPQEYVLVYDFVPDQLKLLSPVANTAFASGTDMYIYWDAPADPGTTRVEFSQDNGSSWITIAAAVPVNTRYLQWNTGTVNSAQCKVRISRGSKSDISGSFVICPQPSLSLNADQCIGHCAVTWTNVPGADKYYMLLKKGPHFVKVDSVSGGLLTYTFSGLDPGAAGYFAVMPSISSSEGFRSKALVYQPDKGTCVAVADGDLAVDSLLAPVSGRRFTTSELKSGTGIRINVRNQDDNSVLNYSASYKVNGGPWKTISGLGVSANTNVQPVIDVYDFSDTIKYTITVAVTNNDRLDPVSSNDTIVRTIWHIPNKPLVLASPLNNGFEEMPDLTLLHDSTGLTQDGYWDFTNSSDTGRLRSRIPGSPLVKSSRSVSLDVNMNAKKTVNFFTGTFNLSNYDTTADEVRFDFQYEMRGMPVLRDSNKVWVRGAETDPWITALVYDNKVDATKLHESGTLSLRDLLRSNKQNFSASSQIRFGQYDTTLIVDDSYGGGLTIDNVNLYKVSKDLQLKGIISPAVSNCAITSADVAIKIRNGTANAMSGIVVGYQLDGGAPHTELLSSGIAGDDSLVYTFTAGLSGLNKGDHVLKVWLHSTGDDFLKNDTIADYHFYIAPLISTFPYLEQFEGGDGDWYAGGRNSSWAYGSPSSELIRNAASGRKAWKTNLAGKYNSNEFSFLISPCLNTAGLDKPMLSFSTAFDIEQCDATICDRFFIEYSTDNEQTWNRLSAAGSTNWYNDATNQIWKGSQTRWHVASCALPRVPQLKLRFVLQTDIGTAMEGIAIDDIHVFDMELPILSLNGRESGSASVALVSGTSWWLLQDQQKIIAAIQSPGLNFGKVTAGVYAHEALADPVRRQYYGPRNWVLRRQTELNAPVSVRLFLTDAEVQRMLSDTNCKTCTRAADIYRTGITLYAATDRQLEDSSLRNNTAAGYTFYPWPSIKWVPYDKGYYGEVQTSDLGEFWLNDGGILGSLPMNTEYVTLNARKVTEQEVELSWHCTIDSAVTGYELQRSTDSLHFSAIATITSDKKYDYRHTDNPALKTDSFAWYRLLGTATNGRTFYSNTASVQWTKGDQLIRVYPVPSSDGLVRIRWTGAVGSSAALRLCDVTGKTLVTRQLSSVSWTNESVLDLSFLSKGVYLLEINIGGQQYREKVIFK